jgi:TonB family protein
MKPAFPAVVIIAALGLFCAPAASARQAVQQDRWPPPGVYVPGRDGIAPPKIVSEVKPSYTRDAMRARITGIVRMECVVNADGTVGAVKVVGPLDPVHGLDAMAVEAVKQWRFAPATKDGVVVPVLVSIEMTFTLRDGPPPPLEWPRAFVSRATPAWTEHELDAPELRVRISLPEGWHVHTDDRRNDLIFAHDRTGALTVGLGRPRPTPVRIERRLSEAEMQRAMDAVKPITGGAGTGSVLAGAGQVEIASRLWFWIEAHLPTFDPATGFLPADLATQPYWETGRLWIFSATAGGQMLQVSMMLLYPRGTSASDMEQQTREAGADFAAILERISVTSR